jgi:separase
VQIRCVTMKLSFCRILTEESSTKYLTLLVDALSRCAIFLAAESSFFNANLVREFCVATLGECEKAQMKEHLPTVGVTSRLFAITRIT